MNLLKTDRGENREDMISHANQILLQHAYQNGYVSVFASLLCSTIVFIGFVNSGYNTFIISWFVFVVCLTVMRYLLIKAYEKYYQENQISHWQNLFLIGTIFAGLSWGFLTYFLFPVSSQSQQILIVLVLAGVTAGASPALSAIKTASICFLWLSIFPLVVQISLIQNSIFRLFDITLFIYVIYMTKFSLKTHQIIKNSIYLQFENVSLMKALKESSTHDSLTNLENARSFYAKLSDAITCPKKRHKIIGILYIDLDKFKYINDNYGHEMGDNILKCVVTTIKHQLRPTNLFARLGGDEFVVILENVSKNDIVEISERICLAVEKPITFNHVEINISVSIGISLYPDNGLDSQTLVSNADAAMYYVKKHGRNNFRFSSVHEQEKVT